MRTDFAVEKLCNIAPIISNIAEKIAKDTEFKAFMKEYNADKTNRVFMLKIIPILLKNYREEAFEILAIWYEKSVEEIKEQAFSKTSDEVKKIFLDEDFRSFFSSSGASDSVADK